MQMGIYQKEKFSNENEMCFKARLVAKGYAQKEDIDYNDVFSRIVKYNIIQNLLALVE